MYLQAYDSRSVLTVPIHSSQHDQVGAVLQITNRMDGKPFDSQDESCASALASVASRALQNASKFDEVRHKNTILQRELDAHKRVLKSNLVLNPPPEKSLRAVVSTLCSDLWSVIPCSGVRVLLMCGVQLWRITLAEVAGQSETVEYWQSPINEDSGSRQEGATKVVLGSDGGIVGKCMEQGVMQCFNDMSEESQFSKDQDGISSIHVRGLLCVPLIAPCLNAQDDIVKTREKYRLPIEGAVSTPSGHVVGVLQLVNKLDGTPFDSVDEATLCAIGHLAAVQILKAIACVELDKIYESDVTPNDEETQQA